MIGMEKEGKGRVCGVWLNSKLTGDEGSGEGAGERKEGEGGSEGGCMTRGGDARGGATRTSCSSRYRRLAYCDFVALLGLCV